MVTGHAPGPYWPFHQPGVSASAASLAAFGRAALGAEPDFGGASAVEAWRIIFWRVHLEDTTIMVDIC